MGVAQAAVSHWCRSKKGVSASPAHRKMPPCLGLLSGARSMSIGGAGVGGAAVAEVPQAMTLSIIVAPFRCLTAPRLRGVGQPSSCRGATKKAPAAPPLRRLSACAPVSRATVQLSQHRSRIGCETRRCSPDSLTGVAPYARCLVKSTSLPGYYSARAGVGRDRLTGRERGAWQGAASQCASGSPSRAPGVRSASGPRTRPHGLAPRSVR